MGISGMDQYESEALSILSRFNEGILHMCEDSKLQFEICEVMIKHALEFWFNESPMGDISALTSALLNAYLDSYPSPEQKTGSEVVSKA